MAAFSPLLDVLADIPDPRRAEGKLYQLPHVLLFSILATATALVLAPIDVAEKSNEIPAAQTLLAELGVGPGAIVTLDALHCQKNIPRSQHKQISP